MEQQRQNTLIVDLDTNNTTFGELNLSNETIDTSATILANLLLDFIKKGNRLDELTPNSVFGKGGNDE